jgi:Protein of unknown function (DUF2723)
VSDVNRTRARGVEWGVIVPAVLTTVIALVLARNGLMPGVGFWDTAEFQTFGPVMGTGHPTGYPTYAIIGWFAGVVLQPFGDPAVRMNLLSALSVALACGLTVVLVLRLSGSAIVGAVAGVGLAMTPIVWKIATHADGHALHLLFLALLFVLLAAWERDRRGTNGWRDPASVIRDDRQPRDRWLVVASFVFGLSVGNHSLTLLLIPAIGLFVLAVDPGIWRRPRIIATCLGVLVATTVVVYLELPLRAGPFRAPLVYGTPNTLDGFSYVVFAEQFRGAIVDPFGDLGGKLTFLVRLAGDQFGPLAAFIPLGFVATVLVAPRYALLSGLAAAVTLFFDASYVNAEITRYYIGPAFIGWTWLGVLGGATAGAAGGLIHRGGWRADPMRRTGRRPASVALAIVAAGILIAPSIAVFPTRSVAIDESHETDAQAWLTDVLSEMKPNAVVLSWWSYSTPLWYAQRVEHRRMDITILDDRTRLDENLLELTDVIDRILAEGRPVYAIRLDPREVDMLTERYAHEPAGIVHPNELVEVLGPKQVGQ